MSALTVKIAITEPGIGAGAGVADTLRVLADSIEGYENADFTPGMKFCLVDVNGCAVAGFWKVTV